MTRITPSIGLNQTEVKQTYNTMIITPFELINLEQNEHTIFHKTPSIGPNQTTTK